MKYFTLNRLGASILALFLILNFQVVFAQGTAFTYQGRLNNDGAAAMGSFDFQFALYDSDTNGNLVTGPVASSATSVTNGLFTATVDFGSNVFTGQPLWLDISVSPAGSNTFVELTPRQFLASTPYAVQAANANVAASAKTVSAANINGTIAIAQLPSTIVTNDATGVNITGTFAGDAGNLTNIDINALTQAQPQPPVVGWGDNSFGQTTIPTGLSNVVVIAAGAYHSLALQNNGTVVAWGDNTAGQASVPTGLSNVVAIAAGAFHSLALQNNGTVFGWGTNGNGQTSIPIGLSNVVAIAAGDYYSLALQNNGTVIGWGDNSFGQTTIPAGLSNVVAIAAGGYHSLALRNNGTVVGWGANSFGQATIPTSLSNVVAVAAGEYHSLALRSNGTVAGWGDDYVGQTRSVMPNGLSNVVAIAAESEHSLVLKSTGAVVGWGVDNSGETTMPLGLGHITAIATGWSHSLALRPDNNIIGAKPALLTGDNIFTGSIAASSFSGDGSGLTNLSLGALPAVVVTNLGSTISYTPTIGDNNQNFTTTTAQGYYTKVDGIVYVEIWIKWNGKGSAVGGDLVAISLPFVSNSLRPTFALGYVGGVTFSTQLSAFGGQGSAFINLWSLASGSSPIPVTVNDCAASGEIQLSGFYRP